jgi:dTDP-4-amino-4,6-dideoxygalactose transaminase
MLSQGLGASAMYGKALFQIDDVSAKASLYSGDSVAQDFAKRVLTLPTHEFVKAHHLKKMENIIKDVLKSSS